MSKKNRFRFDPLSEEFSVVDSLDFIGTTTLEKTSQFVVDDMICEEDEKKEKKIYSYYLEKDVVKRLKRFARLTEKTYSSVVNRAILEYVDEFGY